MSLYEKQIFYNPECINYIENIRFDIEFLGTSSITEDGIYYVEEEDVFIKRAVAKKSNKIILLTEYEKFKTLSYYNEWDWNQIDIIITDKKPAAVFMEIIESYNIKLIITQIYH